MLMKEAKGSAQEYRTATNLSSVRHPDNQNLAVRTLEMFISILIGFQDTFVTSLTLIFWFYV